MSKYLITLIAALLLMSPLLSEATDLEEDRARADQLLEQGDERGAFKAFRSLARDGDHDAQYLLSTFYATGTGTKQDLNEAYGWAVLAAESGLDKLQVYSDELLAAAENPNKAQKKARNLKRKYGKEALEKKAQRLAVRDAGRRYGSCTGSRLTCSNVDAVNINTAGGAGAPPVAEGGN